MVSLLGAISRPNAATCQTVPAQYQGCAHGTLYALVYNVTLTQQCLTVTILREPIDRVISAFYFHKHDTSEWNDCLLPKSTPDCKFGAQYQNDVVRLFSNHHATWNSYDYEKYTAAPVTRQSLHAAQQFLVDTDLVCFLTDLPACLENMKRLLPADNVDAVTTDTLSVRNVNRKRPARVSNATMNAVRAANQLDVELYAWAVATFGT